MSPCERIDDEAIAIVGMGCRFAPDLDTPERFWSFLLAGRDAVREIPQKRWEPYVSESPRNTAALRNSTRWACCLDDIEGFDAGFFGISPREALNMDPQQRILLEVAWEALEHAGIPPRSLRGSDAAVFVAAFALDYARRTMDDLARIEPWAINGGMLFGIAGRLSHALDLRGPSMLVDTACAGSLTCVHLACQSLWRRETDLAIAGGVNIIAGPGPHAALRATGALAPDGRSKSFAKAADGYGRGEGAGLVVLKRLRDAQGANDRVLATIRGTGVFQDGHTNGMWAPNGEAQEHMLRTVYSHCGISPATIDYVEAHGTGTPVGDRIEAEALARVFGSARSFDRPCLVGSVKPNIGHLESAAGIAGLIKTVQALRTGQLPPSLHTEPSPDIAWDALGLRLVGHITPWPEAAHPRRAAISSYGMGGAIAHAVLESPPAEADVPSLSEAAGMRLFPISAMSEPGLRASAARLAAWLEAHPSVPLSSVGQTLARRRSHLRERAAILASTPAELSARLRRLAAGETAAEYVSACAHSEHEMNPVWVFSGHGAQWPGMGRELLDREPLFAAVMDRLAPAFREELGLSPRELIIESEWNTVRVQAMTFAMQVGLAEVWRHRGLSPAAVIGHSVGELAAAVVAGALELSEAARFACRRALLVGRLAGRGRMTMVNLPFAAVDDRLRGRSDAVAAIAAAPSWTVISGKPSAIEDIETSWSAEGVVARRVQSDTAFHSMQADEILDDIAGSAADLTVHPSPVPLYTTALDDPRSKASRDSKYWVANIRNPVRFVDAIQAACADGHRIFLEISSHPVVAHSIREILLEAKIEDAFVTCSLERNVPELEAILKGLGELYCYGAAVDWAQQHPHGELVDLPTTAWQRRSYWVAPGSGSGSNYGGSHDPESHTLLGSPVIVNGAAPAKLWQTYLDFGCRPYPASHPVSEVEIIPAAVLINTFLVAATQDGRWPILGDVHLRLPIAVTAPRAIQVVLQGGNIRLSSKLLDDTGADEQSWIAHTTAVAERCARAPAQRPEHLDPAAIRARCPQSWSWPEIDALHRRRGVGGYGFAWQVEELHRGAGELIAAVVIAPPPAEHADSWAPVIDGAITLVPLLMPDDVLRMPAHIHSVRVDGSPPARVLVHARLIADSLDTIDVFVADESGRVVIEIQGLRFGTVHGAPGQVGTTHQLVHETTWRPFTPSEAPGPAPDRIILVGDDEVLLSSLARRFQQARASCMHIATPEALAAIPPLASTLVVVAPALPRANEPVEDAAERCTWYLVGTARQLARAATVPWPARLWCLTQGVREARDQAALAHAPLWGAARIIAGEHPDVWGGVIDVSLPATEMTERLFSTLCTAAKEDVIAINPGGDFVARLIPVEGEARYPERECHADGTYLITGGLGALGLEAAHWLTQRGARRLVLLGRRGLPDRRDWDRVADTPIRRQIEAVRALEALGATVRILAVDIADAIQTASALAELASELPPIRGIVHAAGVVHDALVEHTDRQPLAEVMRPKTRGAMLLHRLFPPGTVDFLVLFSSSGHFAGISGQTSYAAANSFLDALARHRHASGTRETISFGWMTWRDLGMAKSLTSAMLEANARGIDAISAVEAFQSWRFAERRGGPYYAILRTLPVPMSRPPVLSLLSHDETAEPDAPADWLQLTGSDLRQWLVVDLREQAAAILKMPTADLEPRRPLTELGMDSVMTVALRVNVQRRYGVELPATILWNTPTVTALAAHLAQQIEERR